MTPDHTEAGLREGVERVRDWALHDPSVSIGEAGLGAKAVADRLSSLLDAVPGDERSRCPTCGSKRQDECCGPHGDLDRTTRHRHDNLSQTKIGCCPDPFHETRAPSASTPEGELENTVRCECGGEFQRNEDGVCCGRCGRRPPAGSFRSPPPDHPEKRCPTCGSHDPAKTGGGYRLTQGRSCPDEWHGIESLRRFSPDLHTEDEEANDGRR